MPELPEEERALIEARVRAEREAQKKVDAEEEAAKTAKKWKEAREALFGCLFLIVVVALGVAVCGPTDSAANPSPEAATSRTLRTGEEGFVRTHDGGDSLLLPSPEAFDEYFKAYESNDPETRLAVAIAYDPKAIPTGTRIRCLERKGLLGMWARVRVLEGTFEGKAGWIQGEHARTE